MFTKLYDTIDELKAISTNRAQILLEFYDQMVTAVKNINTNIEKITNMENTIASQQRTIESQQRTIEQLTNALKDKYEHGLFIFSEDCKMPMVIRNGKELTNQLTSCFSICWEPGEAPNIQIEQFAGTHHDMEV